MRREGDRRGEERKGGGGGGRGEGWGEMGRGGKKEEVRAAIFDPSIAVTSLHTTPCQECSSVTEHISVGFTRNGSSSDLMMCTCSAHLCLEPPDSTHFLAPASSPPSTDLLQDLLQVDIGLCGSELLLNNEPVHLGQHQHRANPLLPSLGE